MLVPIILAIPGIIACHLYGGENSIQDSAYSVLVSHVLPTPLIGSWLTKSFSIMRAVVFNAKVCGDVLCSGGISLVFDALKG